MASLFSRSGSSWIYSRKLKLYYTFTVMCQKAFDDEFVYENQLCVQSSVMTLLSLLEVKTLLNLIYCLFS